MIGAVIGPGGKVIQDIQKTKGKTITITANDNKGVVDIFGLDKDCLLYTSWWRRRWPKTSKGSST